MAKKAAQAEAKVETKAVEAVTSYKGFDHELKCRGFRFEAGKTYTVEGKIEACRNGFHAVDADNPFHVWDFYPIIDDEGRLARYAEVIQTGDMSREEDDNKRGTKIASASITIKAELSLPEFIRKAVSRIVETTRGKDDEATKNYAQIGSSGDSAQIGSSGGSAKIGSSGYYAQIGSSGGSAQIGSSGYYAKIGSSGGSAKIGSSGYYAQIGSSGDSAQIGSSGYSAKIGSSGYYAQIGSSGDSAKIGSGGGSAKIGSSGDYAKIDVSGADGVVASAGINALVKAKAGTWVSVAEFDESSPPKCIGFATGKVGEDGIPADAWLVAKGGKLVAA